MNLEEQLGPEWYTLLGPLFQQGWMERLGRRLSVVADKGHLRPSLPEVFKAYKMCQPSQLKVLILAQD